MDLPLDKIGKLLGLLKIVEGVKIVAGKLSTPDGVGFFGFKVTIDDGLPEPKLDYARERVIEVLRKLPSEYKVTVHSSTNISIET